MKLLETSTILVLSFLIGSCTGEILKLTLPQNILNHWVFNGNAVIGFPAYQLNLKVINISFGLKVVVNNLSLIGILIAAVILLSRIILVKSKS